MEGCGGVLRGMEGCGEAQRDRALESQAWGEAPGPRVQLAPLLKTPCPPSED